jgi:hypothetical protein
LRQVEADLREVISVTGIVFKLLAGLGGIGGILAGGFLGMLPQLASAIMAVLRGILAIIADLSQSEFGRHVLGALLAGAVCLYCYHAGYVQGLTSASAQAHNLTKPCPQSHEPAGILDFFGGN